MTLKFPEKSTQKLILFALHGTFGNNTHCSDMERGAESSEAKIIKQNSPVACFVNEPTCPADASPQHATWQYLFGPAFVFNWYIRFAECFIENLIDAGFLRVKKLREPIYISQ